MIDREKYYITACRYAIRQIVKTGSDYFTIVDGDEMLCVPWDNVLDWFDKKVGDGNDK